MSASFTAVDLSKLPVPPVIEVVDYETLLAEMLATLRQYDPQFSALVESDPAYKILEVCAYYRMLDRQRVNDAARAVMLAYAQGGDLDQLGANMGVARLMLSPGDPDRSIPPTMESDEDFRRRIQIAPEGFSVAGPEGAYVFHGLSADPRVLDVSAASPSPGDVVVTVLSREGDGTASPEVLAAVEAALTAESVRPMTDHVIVQSATIKPYTISAEIFTFAGPDSSVVMAEAQARIERFVVEQHRLGRNIQRSAIFAALHAEGVQNVILSQPSASIDVDRDEAAYCTGITITHGGIGE